MRKANRFIGLRRAVVVAAMLLSAFAAPASGSDLVAERAGKVVVVDFWASWCGPCRRSFPWMNSIVDKYGDEGLVIVAVNVDKDRAAADAFLAELPANFEIEFDPEGALAKEFGVEAMPSSFVFDRNGELVARHFGFKVKKQDEYEAVLVKALGENP